MSQKNKKIYLITYVALFVAIISIISQISIPMPSSVPLTFQLLAVIFTGYLLKPHIAALTVLVYLAIGAAGAPVFASFKGGFHVLLEYTGGFVWGFIVVAILCSVFAKGRCSVLVGIASVIICHAFGIVQYMLISNLSFQASFIAISLPYLLKDILSVPLARFFAQKVYDVTPISMKELGLVNSGLNSVKKGTRINK